MVWYGAGTRKLGDDDGVVTGGGTEIKVSISSHSYPISMGIPSQHITT